MFGYNSDRQYNVWLDKEKLPGCCGIGVISGFDQHSTAMLRKHQKRFIDYIKEYIDPDRNSEAIVLASIFHGQIGTVVPILKACGFKPVSRGVNHNHQDHKVFLWEKVLRKTTMDYLPKKAKRKVRKLKARGR